MNVNMYVGMCKRFHGLSNSIPVFDFFSDQTCKLIYMPPKSTGIITDMNAITEFRYPNATHADVSRIAHSPQRGMQSYKMYKCCCEAVV